MKFKIEDKVEKAAWISAIVSEISFFDNLQEECILVDIFTSLFSFKKRRQKTQKEKEETI